MLTLLFRKWKQCFKNLSYCFFLIKYSFCVLQTIWPYISVTLNYIVNIELRCLSVQRFCKRMHLAGVLTQYQELDYIRNSEYMYGLIMIISEYNVSLVLIQCWTANFCSFEKLSVTWMIVLSPTCKIAVNYFVYE